MLQWLWSWFDFFFRLSDIRVYTLCLISLVMSSYPFETIGAWPHVAMVVVFALIFRLSDIYTLLISLMMSLYSSIYNDMLYILLLYGFALNIFPSWVELKRWRTCHRKKGSTRSERRKIKHALGWYGRDCRRGIHYLARFASCTQLNFGTRLWRHKSFAVTKYI